MITQDTFNVKTEKTIVRYNRQLNQWQTVNGKVSNFGSGNDAKRRATRHALRCDWPAMFEAVVNLWAARYVDGQENLFWDRLLKAASMLAQGNVYSNGRVKSQSEPDTVYTVTNGACDCPDFENGLQRQAGLVEWGGVDTIAAGLHCKHTLAIELAKRAGLQLPDEEIPF